MAPILEGKELEGKIGEVGTYSVDVDHKGKVSALIGIDLDKELTPGVNAKLKVDGGFEVKVVQLVAAQAAKSNNKILKFIADALAKLDSGDEVAPALVAMADDHEAATNAAKA